MGCKIRKARSDKSKSSSKSQANHQAKQKQFTENETATVNEDDTGKLRNQGFLSYDEADQLLQNAQQLNAVFDAAERAGFPHSTATMDALNLIVSDYGSEAVIRAIGGCVENSVIKLNYLRGILKSDPTGGAKPKEEAYTPKTAGIHGASSPI